MVERVRLSRYTLHGMTPEQNERRNARRRTGNPVGRPARYRREYIQQVVKFCRDGYSLTSFAGEIGLSRKEIGEWAERYPEFGTACDRAKAAALRWWEKKAHLNANRGASGGQVAMTIFMLRNFGEADFQEKIKHTGPDGGPLSLELLLGKLNQPDVISSLPAETSSQTPLFITDSRAREEDELAESSSAAEPQKP